MDFDEKKRRQLIRVIIAEIGMVVSAAAIAVVAVLAAMGFSISGNGSIEQTGLVQLHSLPTGASVKIDGNSIFYRTNLSRTLSSGDHLIELSRDRYDTWSKTIQIKSGMLLRVYYPRLFLQDRVTEKVQVLNAETAELEFYSTSKSRNYILYAEQESTIWQLMDIRGDDPKVVPLDLSQFLPGSIRKNGTVGYRFDGTVDEIRWSDNDDVVLAKVSYQDQTEWLSVNLRDVKKSVNVSKTFGIGAAQLGLIDGSANQFFVLENRQIRRVNVTDGVMSRVLLDNVKEFVNRGSSLIYIAEGKKSQQDIIGVYRDDEKDGTVIKQVPAGTQVKVALSSYYGDDYIIYTLDNRLTIMYGKIPSYVEEGADLSDLKMLIEDEVLTDIPSSLTMSPNGDYVVAKYDTLAMVTDLETGQLSEYELPIAKLSWFDASMMYAIIDQQIKVWDFDGTNQRNLAESTTPLKENVGAESRYGVVVTANNRWLYYVVADSGQITLVREKIRD